MTLTPDDEMISFLKDPSTDPLIRNSAVQYVLGCTVEIKGIEHLLQNKGYLTALCNIAKQESEIGRNACKCLVNISSHEAGALALSDINEMSFFEWLVDGISDSDSAFVNLKCHVISNISRYEVLSEKLASWFLSSIESFKKLIDQFCHKHNAEEDKYSNLASLFSNITQASSGQRLFLDKDFAFIKDILPYTTYMSSETRRIGVVRAIRNCCFDIDNHMWLLQETDLLPSLLLPLAGPEEFDDDETDKLPPELQYLPEDKEREPNPAIRKLLIEAIMKLCATQPGRLFIKDSGTYYIMRELYNWEEKQESSFLNTCLNLIDILIGDEPEKGMENLMKVEIPDYVQKQFEEELKDCPVEETEEMTIPLKS